MRNGWLLKILEIVVAQLIRIPPDGTSGRGCSALDFSEGLPIEGSRDLLV